MQARSVGSSNENHERLIRKLGLIAGPCLECYIFLVPLEQCFSTCESGPPRWKMAIKPDRSGRSFFF